MTECKQLEFNLQTEKALNRKIIVTNNGTPTSSDGGLFLIQKADEKLGLTKEVANILNDSRQMLKVDHSLLSILRQRVYGICQGYEDGNDHDILRTDEVLQVTVGREGETLSSQPTISRFENSQTMREVKKTNKIILKNAINILEDSEVITIDFDTTDDRTHGHQQLSFFNGYYHHHIYHQLIVTLNNRLAFVLLKPGNVHVNKGAAPILRMIVKEIRKRYPDGEIIFRADGGFATPKLYNMAEKLEIYYTIAMIGNNRLKKFSNNDSSKAQRDYDDYGQKATYYNECRYQADSWKNKRRVIFKAEVLTLGKNTRFVVTNIPKTMCNAQVIYEYYCLRGDMENRIKDLKNAIKSDRTSCSNYFANAFRLTLHALAYLLLETIRDAAKNTRYRNAQFDTIRLRLLKVSAWVKKSVRRLKINLPKAFVDASVYFHVLQRLLPQKL